MRLLGLGLSIAIVTVVACSNGPPTPEQRLEKSATTVARFLDGYERFDDVPLADSVDLYLGPGAGAGHARMARTSLRDPHAWQIGADSSAISFVPRGLRTRVVTAVGRYMNCRTSDLKASFPALASHPHVGVRLEPPQVKKCTDTWNATFVFDTTGGVTKLIAAIYDKPVDD
jgi:hypothetical protein